MVLLSGVLLWAGGALAGKWDGEDPDLRAERVIAASPAQIAAVLTDLDQVRRLWPAECVGVWTTGEPARGKGANASVRYDMAVMHRTLTLTVTAVAVNYIDHDHAGKKGFVTRYILTDLGAPGSGAGAAGAPSTRVEMKTPIYAPRWPLTGYYYRAVQPEWEQCQADVLEALAAAVGG